MVLVAALGCSSSTKNTDKFTGTWTFSQGTFTAACPPPVGTLPNNLAGDMMTLSNGTSSDLTSTLHTSYGDCMLQLSVDGSVASASPNQTCALNVPFGGATVPVTLTVTSWTLTSSSSGGVDTLTTSAMGTANAAGLDCPVTVSGVASRAGGPADAGPG